MRKRNRHLYQFSFFFSPPSNPWRISISAMAKVLWDTDTTAELLKFIPHQLTQNLSLKFSFFSSGRSEWLHLPLCTHRQHMFLLLSYCWFWMFSIDDGRHLCLSLSLSLFLRFVRKWCESFKNYISIFFYFTSHRTFSFCTYTQNAKARFSSSLNLESLFLLFDRSLLRHISRIYS